MRQVLTLSNIYKEYAKEGKMPRKQTNSTCSPTHIPKIIPPKEDKSQIEVFN
jgi:hypothetical protein